MPGSNAKLNHTASIALVPSNGGVCLVQTATAMCNSFPLGFHQCSLVGVEYDGVEKPGFHGLSVAEPQCRDHIQLLRGHENFCYLPNEKSGNQLQWFLANILKNQKKLCEGLLN